MSYNTSYRSSIKSAPQAVPDPDHVKRRLRDAGRKASYHANKLGVDISDVIGKQNHVLPQSASAHVNDVVERNYDPARDVAQEHSGTALGRALDEMVHQYERWKMTREYKSG